VAGGWVNDDEPNSVYVYWQRRQQCFSVFSFLQILEHEVLHSVLLRLFEVEISMRLDCVHRSTRVHLEDGGFVFANRFGFGRQWMFPPYFEEPREDLL
jgi:hypothetical protein